jgi:hypothetical protein
MTHSLPKLCLGIGLSILVFGFRSQLAQANSPTPIESPETSENQPDLSEPLPQAPEPPPPETPAENFWTRPYLTGDWDGWRSRLQEKGVNFNNTFAKLEGSI